LVKQTFLNNILELILVVSYLAYDVRTSGRWKNSLALSVTWHPDQNLTMAVMYGCTDENIEEVLNELRKIDIAVLHPLIMPTILAELERRRMIDMVRESVGELRTKVINYGRQQADIAGDHDKETLSLWLQIHHMRNELESWRKELLSLQTHARELSESGELNNIMKEKGEKIYERAEEMIREYEENAGLCTMVLDGLALSTQFVSSLWLVGVVFPRFALTNCVATGVEPTS
jgi:hypothetical protein